ncbi:MAG TPA: hypothetical protein DCP92_07855 [Nitrospiraceae bacterium]|nr:hypothetical protein [Nitrospiraceae bacterium]
MGEADITPRDLNIFRILSSGPAQLGFIQQQLELFKRDERSHRPEEDPDHTDIEPEEAQPSKRDEKSRQVYLARRVLIARLSQLGKSGLIASKRYRAMTGRGVFTLYSLTPTSHDILVQDGYAREHIRMNLPHKYGVTHELAVTGVVRSIKREAGAIHYGFSIKDENTLRSESKNRRGRFPDLLVTINVPRSHEGAVRKVLALEVDNSTEDPAYVVAKARGLAQKKKLPSLILCNDSRRIEELRRKFAELGKETLRLMVFFSLLNDFTSKGFAATRWLTIDGRAAEVIKSK